jgi:hypothetical protein
LKNCKEPEIAELERVRERLLGVTVRKMVDERTNMMRTLAVPGGMIPESLESRDRGVIRCNLNFQSMTLAAVL